MIIKFDGTEYEDITFDSAEIKALEYDGQGMGAKNFSFYLYHEDDNIHQSIMTRLSSYDANAVMYEHDWDSSLSGVPALCNTDGRYGDVWKVTHIPDEYYTCENLEITAQLLDGLDNGKNNSGVFSHGAVTPLPLLEPVLLLAYCSTDGRIAATIYNKNPYAVDCYYDIYLQSGSNRYCVTSSERVSIAASDNLVKVVYYTETIYDECYLEVSISNPVTNASKSATLTVAAEESEETAETETTTETAE